ncbi:hypothetical protein HN51_016818 [Arachis hypogaea]|uniref:DNA-directed RNA polymerase n=1 Tax=Arachis hypogaea TaxID=3818 RepID=A0A445CUN6_ARAHY|nr:hypothetical protein Ahy_A06g029956 isoform A [Arachis hypogaea]RYR54647.1 hypothetical protein Ahy_A06g029956 isoform B [Arachis hypogaea]
MQKDAQEDPAIFSDTLHARRLVNQVDRKLVKQTMMTSVYGVTYIGAREQIKRRLKERESGLDDDELFGASCYAAKVTLTALEEMFQGARNIMKWLCDYAKISQSTGDWTTPLGLPVVQPYRKLGRHIVKTSLKMLTLQRETDKVMAKRQRTAFLPNFVHSLDGTHMMMAAVAYKKEGLNFAGVYDSYWTHACDVDRMNRILREKFVEPYETPVLENLKESFQGSFSILMFPPFSVALCRAWTLSLGFIDCILSYFDMCIIATIVLPNALPNALAIQAVPQWHYISLKASRVLRRTLVWYDNINSLVPLEFLRIYTLTPDRSFRSFCNHDAFKKKIAKG